MNKGIFGFPKLFRDESFHSFPKKKVSGESFFGFPSGREDYDFKLYVPTSNTTRAITLGGYGTITIDWGDGSSQLINLGAPISFTHTYSQVGNYNVIVLGETFNISDLRIQAGGVVAVRQDFSKFRNVIFLRIDREDMSPSTLSFPDLSTLSKLVVVWMNGGGWTGEFPKFTTTSLVTVYLQNNKLSGDISSLGLSQTLKALYLQSNKLLSSGVDALGSIVGIDTIDISDNNFSGTLPSFNDCNLLTSFQIFSNKFTGTLPSFLGCTSLITCNINNNLFTGTLTSFNGLTNLVTFNCSNNQFSGNIPPFMECSNLQLLNGDSNSFEGILPIAPSSIINYRFGFNRTNALEVPVNVVTSCLNLVLFSTYLSAIGGSRTVPDISNNTKLETLQFNDGVVAGQYYNNGTLVFNTSVLKVGMFNYCTGINFDFTNLIAPSLANTNFQSIGTNLDITYPLGTALKSLVFYLNNNLMSQINVDGTINSMFINRLSFNNTLAKTLTVAGTNAAPSGIYQQPLGFSHDLTEAQIDALTTTPKEKIWILVNGQNSIADTTKRYKWTITTA